MFSIRTKSLQSRFSDDVTFRCEHNHGKSSLSASTTIIIIVQRNNKINTAKFLWKSAGAAAWRQVNRKNCTCVCVCVSAWDFSPKRRDRNSSTSWTATGRIHRRCTGFQFRGDDIINVLCTGPSTSTRRRFSRISLMMIVFFWHDANRCVSRKNLKSMLQVFQKVWLHNTARLTSNVRLFSHFNERNERYWLYWRRVERAKS